MEHIWNGWHGNGKGSGIRCGKMEKEMKMDPLPDPVRKWNPFFRYRGHEKEAGTLKKKKEIPL